MRSVRYITCVVVMALSLITGFRGPAVAQSIGAQRILTAQSVDLQSKRELIRNIQRYLKAIGYYRGQIDGLYGDGTHRAWARFAVEHGLNITEMNRESYNILRAYAESVASRRSPRPAEPDYSIVRDVDLAFDIYDIYPNGRRLSLDECANQCSNDYNCVGFAFVKRRNYNGARCWPKSGLHGYHETRYVDFYVKVTD